MSESTPTKRAELVGVVAIQGDYAKHLEMLTTLSIKSKEIRVPEELTGVTRLIIPGGESTTVGLLMQQLGLGVAIQELSASKVPIWGTCMGMIMMATDIEGRSNQYTLNLLDITVQRNAFGAQVHSFEDHVPILNQSEPVMGVFIRAPVVTRVGPGIEVIGRYQDKVVAVRSGNNIGTSFHPELTRDTRMHEYFMNV